MIDLSIAQKFLSLIASRRVVSEARKHRVEQLIARAYLLGCHRTSPDLFFVSQLKLHRSPVTSPIFVLGNQPARTTRGGTLLREFNFSGS